MRGAEGGAGAAARARPEGAGEQVGLPWAPRPSGPAFPHPWDQPHQGALVRPQAPLTLTTSHHHSQTHPKVQPVPDLPRRANPPQSLGPAGVGPSVAALSWPRLSPRPG